MQQVRFMVKKFILPEFLSLKLELCCPKFLVKSPEIVSYVT